MTLDELVAHVTALAAATPLPLSVDSEHGFADTLAGVAETVRRLAAAGAAGCSIEDYDPATGAIDAVGPAAERVAAAVDAAHADGLVLTARAENLLHEVEDLEDTIARLRAYRAAGADVVYAPGLTSMAEISAVVTEVDAPVNVLHAAGGAEGRRAGQARRAPRLHRVAARERRLRRPARGRPRAARAGHRGVCPRCADRRREGRCILGAFTVECAP